VLANKTRTISFIIALGGAIWAWMVHSSNLTYYQHENGLSGIDMILTADDASYVTPAHNFYQNGVWKDNSEGVSAYVQRPPMIGMLHFALMTLKQDASVQKYVAVILHGIAIFLLGLMAIEMFGRTKGIIIQCLYALLPCFWGYLFYFLTESITPSLLVILLFGYFRFYHKHAAKWLFFQGLMIGILLLTRPQLALFSLPFFYNIGWYIRNKQHNRYFTSFLSLVFALGGFGLWQIRSIMIANDFVGIHPIYHITNNSQYRPVHRSFGNMFRVWEHNSEKFHSIMTPFWDGVVLPEEAVEHALNNIPHKIYEIVPRNEFDTLFTMYTKTIALAHQTKWPASMGHKGFPIEGYPEKQVHLKADSITRILRRKLWMDNLVITPVHSAQWMFTKSQLNLLIFQRKYRGQWWMEGLRYFCVGLISLLTLLSISQIANRKNKMFLLMALAIIVYLFYLFFIQKMNEERYLMPLLPIFLLLGTDRLITLFRRLKR
jgi:4-amino-4-deoxy-L-arabinose transferase-like glycosyltransferase